MKDFLRLVLQNAWLLVVPAVGFVLSLVVLRTKRRYVKEGVLFRRLSTAERANRHPKSTEEEMNADSHIDLEIALRKFHELGLEDGDLGYAYWHEVGQLLKRAAGMQSRIDELRKKLEQCRARPSKAD
ncbi:hypothetical protein VOM14_16465 [Paraburkholderia sp. MPAMCS5]|uniref:hypothetical protein n=1 Tax=Paraburkholderia sp. MPAMCS5 TaxID=3112563 RepID=UPI002E19FD6D|nr:hypothetical protein [Paraburkholderia sp. MPAMCS5]